MSAVCFSMALELENNDKKKVFARWKENLRDFFIEDEKIDKSLIDKETETMIDDNLKTEDTEKEDEVIEKAEEQIIENNCTSTTNGNGELEKILEDGEESCAQEENNVEQVFNKYRCIFFESKEKTNFNNEIQRHLTIVN